jgi:glycosyltransferase involved in cell wall biosynthesis
VESLREHVREGELLGLYVGNLEHYQGMHLMLDALARLPAAAPIKLLVIGGEPAHVALYQEHAARLWIEAKVKVLGPRPVAALPKYLLQADLLFSPRTLGGNTPMKVYSYMQSARPIVATRIRSHTQVLDDSCAMLCDPTPEAIADGTLKLLDDAALRARLGTAAARKVDTEFSLPIFRRRLLDAYSLLAAPSG